VEFKPGQKVVYPNHGIALIEQIETRDINGEAREFFLLRLQENSSIVMVPCSNIAGVGLRRPIAAKQCDELLKLLASDFAAPPTDWKDRFREFSDRMRGGDIFLIAEVLKTLTWLNQIKPLSFREKRMLERARYLVISEIASVCRQTEMKVQSKVDEAIHGACIIHTRAFASAAGTGDGH
jgi:CarD family transcriptional regulator